MLVIADTSSMEFASDAMRAATYPPAPHESDKQVHTPYADPSVKIE